MRFSSSAWRVTLAVLLVSAAAFLGCNQDTPNEPTNIILNGTAQMKLRFDVGANQDIDSGTVTITKGEVEQTQGFEIEDGTATVLFTGLQPGMWTIEVMLYDGDGYLIYEGRGTAGVHGGQITTANIVLDELVGGLEVIVRIPPQTEFVLIPAGAFIMGSPEDELGRYDNETLHQVTLTHPFYIQNTEVTNQQYMELAQWAVDSGYAVATTSSLLDALDGSTVELLDLDDSDCEIDYNGSEFSCENPAHPVKVVSWYGSVAYCDWLSLEVGLPRAYDHATWQCNSHDPYNAQGYRLPTEAEWECACRSGTQTPFNTGECLDAGVEANYNGNYPYLDCPVGPYVGWTVPVGSYPANVRGLYEMHGNLWEWCNDWYGGDYGGDETDPVGPWSGVVRVFRGSYWYGLARTCRSAQRDSAYPDRSDFVIGFRTVRSAN